MRITLTGLLLATAIFGFSATMSIGCTSSTPAETEDHDDHDHDDHDHEHGDHEHGDHEHGDHEHGDHEHGDHEHGDHEHGDHEHGDHDHDEHAGHDHGEIGPNGGHIVELEGGDLHLEWVHAEGKQPADAEKIITFYVLDADGKKEMPIAAEALTVNLTTGGETKKFEAKADRPEGADKTAKFVLTDEFAATIMLSEEVDAVVSFKVDGKELKAKIEDHHHH
ncbi:hypothetical protein [Blastopirellula retiformator]|uniref:Uncharacterized protein n=1 Tax=Blastopirellula retiformator TaxID=2527970 RepID=A0A5C5V1V1_9BACT|nr:hypothetical protein [Blastopirellula retiformator]TWT31682.1 hypothetical protein Enr8_36060 [Blastopirellula retiformator]